MKPSEQRPQPRVAYRADDPAVIADPFPTFARLRDEDPAHWNPGLRAWVITRYADNKALLTDRSLSSNRLQPFFDSLTGGERERIADIVRYLGLWMVFKDPPEHTRLRRLSSQVFNVATMHAMRPRIEARIDRLLDALEGRREVDFVADFAGPLPALVIMDMLGVPEQELARVKDLSDRMALFIGSARASAQKYAIAQAATREMAGFFRELIAARRRAPADDLLGQLVALRGEPQPGAPDGEQLSEDELVATAILLLFAGHETTTNHLANGLASLLRFPDEMAALRAEPALAAAAVEELLRYDGPSISQVRIATQPTRLHERTIQPGDRIFLMLNAANRDPRAYDDPDKLDLDRDGVAHLTFGWGTHICLGFPLARLEGQLAFPRVLARWPRIARAAGEVHWHPSLVFRGMTALPLRLG